MTLQDAIEIALCIRKLIHNSFFLRQLIPFYTYLVPLGALSVIFSALFPFVNKFKSYSKKLNTGLFCKNTIPTEKLKF